MLYLLLVQLIKICIHFILIKDNPFGMRKQPQLNKNNSKEFPSLEQKTMKVERVLCNCVAQKHPLINNCLNCGKVICQSEGQGPCLFCGNVVSKRNNTYLDRDDKELFPDMNQEQLKKLGIERSKAIQHKNILVDRDNSNNIVSNIYDQQVDYYQLSQNQWANDEVRKYAIDRILNEKKYVDDESSTVRMHFDAVSGQWVRDQFIYSEEGFKKEAQDYVKQSQTKQILDKHKKTKDQSTVDERLRKNQKLNKIYENIKQQLAPEVTKKNKVMQEKVYKGIQVVQDV